MPNLWQHLGISHTEWANQETSRSFLKDKKIKLMNKQMNPEEWFVLYWNKGGQWLRTSLRSSNRGNALHMGGRKFEIRMGKSLVEMEYNSGRKSCGVIFKDFCS